MEQKNEKVWPFRIQFITLALIPLILVAINIPDSAVLGSWILGGLRRIGLAAVGVVLLFAFPIGMIGFRNARDEKMRLDLERATMYLGVANCIVGAMFVGIVLMILFFTFVMGV